MDSVIENYLEIDEPLEFDESVESFEYREHWPDGGENNLNGQGREIRININDLDLFTFPAESYLQVVFYGTQQMMRIMLIWQISHWLIMALCTCSMPLDTK